MVFWGTVFLLNVFLGGHEVRLGIWQSLVLLFIISAISFMAGINLGLDENHRRGSRHVKTPLGTIDTDQLGYTYSKNSEDKENGGKNK